LWLGFVKVLIFVLMVMLHPLVTVYEKIITETEGWKIL